MTVTELVTKLNNMLARHGDIEVIGFVENGEYEFDIDSIEFNDDDAFADYVLLQLEPK